eukprot:TRINITY_DN12756_c1_g2_i1.p1 TRINITY_DN12756_c1_g2~~TRINITY_DN12756_c1_g2_i1.p1  ORF type:complete len:673 (-),score=69.15 TRINITY_DN12756_c1_g2_i1:26-1975(-)
MAKQISHTLRGWMLVVLLLSREVHCLRNEIQKNRSSMEQGFKSHEMQATATEQGFTSHDAHGLAAHVLSGVVAPHSTTKPSPKVPQLPTKLPEAWAVMTSDVMYKGEGCVLAVHKLPGRDTGCRLKLYKAGAKEPLETFDIDKSGVVGKNKDGDLYVETLSSKLPSTFTARPRGGKAYFTGLSVGTVVRITNPDTAGGLLNWPGRIAKLWVYENRLVYEIKMEHGRGTFRKVEATDVEAVNDVVDADEFGEKYALEFDDDALLDMWISVIMMTQAIGTCLADGTCLAQCTYVREQKNCWPPNFCEVVEKRGVHTCKALKDDENNAEAFKELLRNAHEKVSKLPTTLILKPGFTKHLQEVSNLVKYVTAVHKNTLESPSYPDSETRHPSYAKRLQKSSASVKDLQKGFMNGLDQALATHSLLSLALHQSGCTLKMGALPKVFEEAKKGSHKPVEKLLSIVRDCKVKLDAKFGDAELPSDSDEEDGLKCFADMNVSDKHSAVQSASRIRVNRSSSAVSHGKPSALAQIGSDQVMASPLDGFATAAIAVGCGIMAFGALWMAACAFLIAFGWLICLLHDVCKAAASLVTEASEDDDSPSFSERWWECTSKLATQGFENMETGGTIFFTGACFMVALGFIHAAGPAAVLYVHP